MYWTLYFVSVYLIFAMAMLIYRLVLMRRIINFDPNLRKYGAYLDRYGFFKAIVRTRIGYFPTTLFIISSYLIFLGYTDRFPKP